MSRRGLLVLAVVALALFGLWLFLARPSPPAEGGLSGRDTAGERGAATPSGSSGNSAGVAPVPRDDGGVRRLDAAGRARRADLERRVAEARARREAERVATAAAAPPPEPRLDKEYIGRRLNEIAPLMKECYELALHERPDLSGRMMLRFRIAGEPGVGGLVEHAAMERTRDGGVAPDGPAEAVLDECITATIETLTFPPPPNGGKVDIAVPMVFASGPPRDGG